MDYRRNLWRLVSLQSCLLLQMSHWISNSSRCFSFPLIILTSSLPCGSGFLSELFKKVTVFPLVWQVSHDPDFLSARDLKLYCLFPIFAIFKHLTMDVIGKILDVVLATFISSLERTSVHNNIFFVIDKSIFVGDKDEYEKTYNSLNSQNCLPHGRHLQLCCLR